jgi:hypothetical protein
VEKGGLLKKLHLTSTSRVHVKQTFEAQAGDQLSFEFAVRLRPGSGDAPVCAAVRAVLVHYEAQISCSLLERSIVGRGNAFRYEPASSFKESLLHTIRAAGRYELQFTTAVDPGSPGAEGHLLIDAAQIAHRLTNAITRIASLSCVGRVAAGVSLKL